MKIFISWSGSRSKAAAITLREWLPIILQYAKPWLSDRDIAAGERWSVEVARELEEASFGIIVVTSDNVDAPWLLFEAGALSKAFTTSAVVPYLVDLDFSALSGPLSLFQAKRAERESTWELVQSINQRASQPVQDAVLVALFEALWPRLSARLQALPLSEAPVKVRSEREVLEDLVESVRRVESKVERSPSRRSFMGIDLGNVAIPLTILIEADLPGLEKGSSVRVVTADDAVADVATMLALPLETYGAEWYLTGTRTRRPIPRDGGIELAKLAQHGQLTLSLRSPESESDT